MGVEKHRTRCGNPLTATNCCFVLQYISNKLPFVLWRGVVTVSTRLQEE